MRETAAELVGLVVPEVPVRQWVLSLPWAMRLPVARDSALLSNRPEVGVTTGRARRGHPDIPAVASSP